MIKMPQCFHYVGLSRRNMYKRHIISISPPYPDVHWNRCVKWCRKYLEERSWHFQGEGVFEFENERDYLWFVMKWT